MALQITQSERNVALFTLIYVGAFTLFFLGIGNYEFIVYIVTMAVLMALVGLTLRQAEYPPAMLWALSAWGLLHMAGGGLPVGGSVLYNLHLVRIIDHPEYFILKYDQLMHGYGYGVAAWLVWHLLVRFFPETRGTKTAFALPVFSAMGLGTLNEMIEFLAVLSVPDTNVGGYYNTAWDLVFNAAGAVIAMLLVYRFNPRSGRAAP